jgi:hypothetical protein
VTPLERESWSARRFGFASLFLWALVGFTLELAHGFKLSSYLDEPLRRELLTLAHAHGVGLSLVVLAYAALGVVDERSIAHGKRLRMASVLIPVGFAAGSVGMSEADPGPVIALVPIGAVLLLWALLSIARAVSSE